MSDVNTKARTMPQPSGANTHLFLLHWLMAHPAQLSHQLWPESLAWFQHNGKVHTDLKCTVVRCCTVNFLISGFLFGLRLLWLLHPSETKLLFIHHHVIIMSSSFHPWNLTGGALQQTQARIFPFFLQICRQASFPLPYSHPPLPNPLLCCHPGGWKVNECFHQHLHQPKFGRSWGCLAPQAAERAVGRYDFGAISACHILQRICPKRIMYSNFFCWDLSFWNHLKKLSNYTFSRVTYIRSKNPGKSQPKSSLFHKKAWRSTLLNRPSGCSDGYGCKTVNIKGGQTRPALTPCKQRARDRDKTRIR